MINFNRTIDSAAWSHAYNYCWGAGVFGLVSYAMLSWPSGTNATNENIFIQLLIYSLFGAGLIGARLCWGLIRYKNLRMFCITLGGGLFIAVLNFRQLGYVNDTALIVITGAYPLSMLLFVSKTRNS